MKLNYKAVTRDGKTLKGIIEAKDVNDAASFLRSRELLPIRIVAQKDEAFSGLFPFSKGPNQSDVVFFTRQLASMLSSGLTLMQALAILKQQIQKPSMVSVVDDVIQNIQEGKSFSVALAKYPKLFSSIYISLIRAAEASGLLDKILLRLAENLEKREKLKSTIRSALMYPMIVVIGMIIVVIIMMLFVIPQLSVLYQSLNIALPLPTQIVIGFSNILRTYFLLFVGLFFLFIYAFRRWKKTEAGRFLFDKATLRLPVIGKLIKETILTEITRTMGLLIGSGTLVVDALTQTADVAGNVIYQSSIVAVSKNVERGISIGDAMSTFAYFPPILVQMVKIGEQTGKLDESLTRVSEYFEREVDESVKGLTTAIEPIIMVFLGVGVAFLIISVITPIYTLTSSIQ